MLIELLLNALIWIIGAVFYLFPSATIAELPWLGSDLSALLIQISAMWHTFMVTFPYATIAWEVLIYVIVPFEVLLLVAKFFLGGHLPAHTTN